MDKKWGPGQRDGSKPYKKSRGYAGFRNRPIGPPDPSPAAENLAEYILQALAAGNGELKITRESSSPADHKLSVTCDPAVTGRLIGKGGRTISALRLLVRAVAERRNKHVEIEIS